MTAGKPIVLVVDDEPQLRKFLRAALTPHGFAVVEAATAAAAKVAATSQPPELVLLDLGLPDGDGLDVLRALREWTRVPVIVLSAREREGDKVAALDAGADDYLTKPFGTGELMARIRVALRHANAARSTGPETSTIEVGPLKIDLAARIVTRDGKELHLTPIEYRLLVLLAKHAGKVLTHRQILMEVWGPPHASQTHYVRVYMGELRKKIELDPARPQLVITEQGVGYRLRVPE
jgi:two-component system KDP operon response regulator KdpE